RSELVDERLQIATREQLHHIVKSSLVGHAEVEEPDRVGRAECGRGLCFPFEPAENQSGLGRRARAEDFRPYQLDGRAPREQAMIRPPYFSHSAATQQLDELVTSQFARRPNLASEPVEHL